MCGIFGATSPQIKNPGEFNYFLRQLMQFSQSRGRDATGFACISNNKFITDKHPMDAKGFSMLSDEWRKTWASDSLAMIGHTRASTNGSPEDNKNNHPFHGPRYSMVHNGMIWHHEWLAKEVGFRLATKCDSEIILHFLEKYDALKDGIVEAMAELDSLGYMAVATLDRKNGQVHLFRTESAPCAVFKFERWNATVFASTAEIVVKAATHVLGSLGDVWEEGEMVYDTNKYGEIPDYAHIVIDADGSVTTVDLNPAITKLLGTTSRGRMSSGYGLAALWDDSYSTTMGGKSKGSRNKKGKKGRQDRDKEVLANTAIIETCPDCRSPVICTPQANGRFACECGCKMVLTQGGRGSSKASKATAVYEAAQDVFDILPEEFYHFRIEDITEALTDIREPSEDLGLSDVAISEFLSYDILRVSEKVTKWGGNTIDDISHMGEGEYRCYFNFVVECIGARMETW